MRRVASRLSDFLKGNANLIFAGIVVIAILLRLVLLTNIPSGINQDEADAAYEAHALLLQGTDKWGNRWPAYFVSWGSGQNVLLSYMEIPVIAVFGLTVFSARIEPAILGVLSVVLLYFLTKKVIGRNVALLASFLLAVLPWAVLSSRVAIESNILPFFLLSGVAAVVYSYESKHAKYLVPFSLIPLILALYAYAVAIVVVPIIVVGAAIIYWQRVMQLKASALASVLVALLLGFPMAVFLLDNFVFHHVPHVFAHLPFSAQTLLTSRLAQNLDAAQGGYIWNNIRFFTSGLMSGIPWDTIEGYSPAILVNVPLATVGCVELLIKGKKGAKLLAVWLIGAFMTALLLPLNLVRANSMMIPLVVLSVYGFVILLKQIKNERLYRVVLATTCLVGVVYVGSFYRDYFRSYNSTYAYQYYNVGFDGALQKANAIALPQDDIYISKSINLNYVYTLFYRGASPSDFQKRSTYYPAMSDVGMIYKVESYGRYQFYPDNKKLATDDSYLYVLKNDDTLQCAKMTTLWQTTYWRVGRCYNGQ